MNRSRRVWQYIIDSNEKDRYTSSGVSAYVSTLALFTAGFAFWSYWLLGAFIKIFWGE